MDETSNAGPVSLPLSACTPLQTKVMGVNTPPLSPAPRVESVRGRMGQVGSLLIRSGFG